MSWTPPPGTIGLTYLHGFPALRAALGQRLLNEHSSYNHAFIVLGNGLVAEPWPSGAVVVPLADFAGEDVAFGWLPGLRDAQREAIVNSATSLLGTGYRLADYRRLARYRAACRRRRVVSDRLVHRLNDTGRLLPAQFVAQAYRQAGVYLFPDRIPQDVSIDQLGDLFLREQGWELRVPCTQFA